MGAAAVYWQQAFCQVRHWSTCWDSPWPSTFPAIVPSAFIIVDFLLSVPGECQSFGKPSSLLLLCSQTSSPTTFPSIISLQPHWKVPVIHLRYASILLLWALSCLEWERVSTSPSPSLGWNATFSVRPLHLLPHLVLPPFPRWSMPPPAHMPILCTLLLPFLKLFISS